MSTPGFRPTHVVPRDGMPAWEAPDPARPTVSLDPLLPVVLAERRGEWGRVECANGWSAWVDGRCLVAVPDDPPTTGGPLAADADPRPLLARAERALAGYRAAVEDLAAGRLDGESFQHRTNGLRLGVVADGGSLWLYDADEGRWLYSDGTRLSTYATDDAPRAAAEPRAATDEAAPRIAPEPRGATGALPPTPAEPSPTPAEPSPTPAEPSPTPAEPPPTTVKPRGATAGPPSTTVEPRDGTAGRPPATVQPSPTTVEPRDGTAGRPPATVQPSPTTVEPRDGTAGRPPATVQPSPTTVEPRDGTAGPPPTTAQPPPAPDEDPRYAPTRVVRPDGDR